MSTPDVDIDTPTSFDPNKIFPWVRASQIRAGELVSHPCGVHPQAAPVDPVTGLCALPYKVADELGYSKIDFLHLNLLNHFRSREEIEELVEVEPDWGLLLIPEHQEKLFQLAKHAEILNQVKPKSVEELADVLALIRPGKKELLKLYLNPANREHARRALYAKGADGYQFKKAHAVAYAMVIVLQLHLINADVI